jgi:hypothetical protein
MDGIVHGIEGRGELNESDLRLQDALKELIGGQMNHREGHRLFIGLPDRLGVPHPQRLDNRFLAREELVERPHGRLGAIRNELHRRRPDPDFHEDRLGGIENLLDAPLPPLLLGSPRGAIRWGSLGGGSHVEEE